MSDPNASASVQNGGKKTGKAEVVGTDPDVVRRPYVHPDPNDARIALGLSRVVRGLDWLAARMQHAGGAAQEAGEQDVAEAWLEAAQMVVEYMDHLRADPAYRTTPTHGGE